MTKATDIQMLCEELHIPNHMHAGIAWYVTRGEPMGDFLTAIFANDFVNAAGMADVHNADALFSYAKLLYQLPAMCWGSHDLISAWIDRGGIQEKRHA